MAYFEKVRNIEKQRIKDGLSIVLARASNFLGIKNGVEIINKQDIAKLIVTRFKNMSFEEMEYAFALERYGMLGEKTKHFQLFNAEYVASVFAKYKKWLSEIRFKNNIPLEIIQESEPEITEEEKLKIVIKGVKDCIMNFTLTGKIDDGRVSYVYEFLHELKLLPKHNQEYKDRIIRKAKSELLQNTPKNLGEFKALKNILKTSTNHEKIKIKCCEIVLKEYFSRIINTKQDFNLILEEALKK